MIRRYTLPEMQRIWSDLNRYAKWLEVELAIVDALCERGIVPKDARDRIKKAARFEVAEIEERENVTQHDVLAFVECVCERLGQDSKYFHMGVTSSDILDTALALIVREATSVILRALQELKTTLANLALANRDVLTIGRTHGMHAEPTSLGLKFAVWYREIQRGVDRISEAAQDLYVGKISGSVGNYSHLPPEVEEMALDHLGLKPERPATQIVQRDRHANYVSSLAVCGASMERIAVELRNLQRTEIGEIEEPFERGQKGSSSMPHKRNPILLERISGLSRLLRSYAMAAMENVALWHERDISHSSVERVILPDATTLVHYMAVKLKGVLERMKIDAQKMRANVDLTKGLVYSQRLMVALMQSGWGRIEAYEKVKELAEEAVSRACDFRDIACEDEDVVKAIGIQKIEEIFEPTYYLRYVDRILHEIGITNHTKLVD